MGRREHETVETDRWCSARRVPMTSTIESIAPTLGFVVGSFVIMWMSRNVSWHDFYGVCMNKRIDRE